MPKGSRQTRDFLLRDLPQDVADKLKVAASLHRVPMKDYIRQVLEIHLDSLEKRGLTLTLTKGKGLKGD
jgi:plasmid stability protein